MRRLLPTPDDPVDLYDEYRPPDRPWLRLNMIGAANGAATDDEGRTGGLAAEGDREVFRTLRALADAILVGAGTARIEGYGPHRLPERLARRRADDGRADPAPIVLVSRSLDFDYSSPLFTEAVTPTMVLTCEAAPEDGLRRAREAGLVVMAGDAAVDLGEGIRLLRDEHGLVVLLCEGGPALNSPLFRDDLVDELCLTVAPKLAGGRIRAIVDDMPGTRDLELAGLCEEDGELYLRYLTARGRA